MAMGIRSGNDREGRSACGIGSVIAGVIFR